MDSIFLSAALRRLRLRIGLCTFLLSLTTAAQAAPAPSCEVNHPVRFSGLSWESNLVLVGIERFILEHGYGCKTQIEIGEPLAMLTALQRGDVDVTAEIWPEHIKEAWQKAINSQRVVGVGHVYDAGEGWYIPRYTAERYPDLKNATDLARFKKVFTDLEEPARGRIYGCPAGWTCGVLNDNLLRALNLEHDYTMFAPGSGAAQKAAIVSAYKRKRDLVFYYWTPTALISSLDLVKLKFPPYNAAAYACLSDPKCSNPVLTDFKTNPVITGLNATFSKAAPHLTEFFTRLVMPEDAINATLGWLETENKEPQEAALYFLKRYHSVWQQWVPEEVAARVNVALKQQ